MRITDRGPFVDGRILDLTIASAKATGVYRAGLAQVRIDVYETPKPIDTGGRWCVQIGAFHRERSARKLKAQLQRKYPDANVIEFPGEDSYWVRIRPLGDNRQQAESITPTAFVPDEGEAFLTRLDLDRDSVKAVSRRAKQKDLHLLFAVAFAFALLAFAFAFLSVIPAENLRSIFRFTPPSQGVIPKARAPGAPLTALP